MSNFDHNSRRLDDFRERNGQFGAHPPRGEADFVFPDGDIVDGDDVALSPAAAFAVATVPSFVRDHARSVLGFVADDDESVLEADARLALDNRDLIGEVPGWGREAYNMLAAGHVAETGTQLHPDDVEDMGAYMHFAGIDDEDVSSAWDAQVRARYAEEAKELLAQMPAAESPF